MRKLRKVVAGQMALPFISGTKPGQVDDCRLPRQPGHLDRLFRQYWLIAFNYDQLGKYAV